MTQMTLSGDEARCGRTRPVTMARCYRCNEWVLRSQFRTHADDHDLPPRPRWGNEFAFNTPRDHNRHENNDHNP